MQLKIQNRISVWLTRHSPRRRRKPKKRICVGPGVVDFLDTLDRDVFEVALIHLSNDLASICILEQENQQARTQRQEDFLDFEDAVNEIHGNHGRIHLSEVATRAVREQIGSEADQNASWNFSDPADQAIMLRSHGYNDDPTTWGPSRYAILSGLADYQISSTKGKKEKVKSVSPLTKEKDSTSKAVLYSLSTRLGRRTKSMKPVISKRNRSPGNFSECSQGLALTSSDIRSRHRM